MGSAYRNGPASAHPLSHSNDLHSVPSLPVPFGHGPLQHWCEHRPILIFCHHWLHAGLVREGKPAGADRFAWNLHPLPPSAHRLQNSYPSFTSSLHAYITVRNVHTPEAHDQDIPLFYPRLPPCNHDHNIRDFDHSIQRERASHTPTCMTFTRVKGFSNTFIMSY